MAVMKSSRLLNIILIITLSLAGSAIGQEFNHSRRRTHTHRPTTGSGISQSLCPWQASYTSYHKNNHNNKSGYTTRSHDQDRATATTTCASNNDDSRTAVTYASSRRSGRIPSLSASEVDLQGLTPWQPEPVVLRPSARRGRSRHGGGMFNGLFGGVLNTWTGKLVALNVAGFGVQMFFPGFTRWGAKVSESILRDYEWHRLISPVFLHGGLAHLAVNSFSILNVGPNVESLFGKPRYLATYLAAGVAGNLASAVMSPRPSVGASGAIFGLIGAYYVFLNTNKQFFGESGKRGRRAMQQTLAMNVMYGLASPQIDNWAHLGGALGGAAMAFTFGPRLYLYDDYDNRRRVIVDKPIARVPKPISNMPSKFKGKLRRLRRKMQTDRYSSSLRPRYNKRRR
jgi:membrane associated rhomboid family serine protease